MNKKNHIILITKITLERFPSRKEIMSLLDLFLYDHNYRKDYQLFIEDNALSIYFYQSEPADGFIKHLQTQKLNNNLYSKLKISISFTPLKDYSSQTTKAKGSLLKLQTHKCPLQKINSCPLLSSKSEKPHQKHPKNRSELSIHASEAFIDNYEKNRQEIRKNKARWVDQRNFNAYVGKASYSKKDFIENYVVKDPSVPAYQFHSNLRISKKFQWLEDKGFL